MSNKQTKKKPLKKRQVRGSSGGVKKRNAKSVKKLRKQDTVTNNENKRRVKSLKRLNLIRNGLQGGNDNNGVKKFKHRSKHLFNTVVLLCGEVVCDRKLTSSSNKGAAGRAAIAFWRSCAGETKLKCCENGLLNVRVSRFSESKVRPAKPLNTMVYKVVIEPMNEIIYKKNKKGEPEPITYKARARATRDWQVGEKRIYPPKNQEDIDKKEEEVKQEAL